MEWVRPIVIAVVGAAGIALYTSSGKHPIRWFGFFLFVAAFPQVVRGPWVGWVSCLVAVLLFSGVAALRRRRAASKPTGF